MLSPFHFALVVLCACPFWAYARGVFLELSCAPPVRAPPSCPLSPPISAKEGYQNRTKGIKTFFLTKMADSQLYRVLMAAPVQIGEESVPVRERCRAPCRESEGRR